MEVSMDLTIFDLDGTLIDSKLDLAHAVNAALEHLGLPRLTLERIASYVGNGAPILMRRAIGPEASEEEVARGLTYFMQYYRDHMLDYTTLYPGVRETLDLLRGRGAQMAVLTNKPVGLSKAIVAGLGLDGHFFQVYGGNSFEQKKPHPVGIEILMSEAGATPGKTMMVGDSSVDVQTARNAGTQSCGVTYGFQPETLAATPPDFLIDRMDQLPGILWQN
jgi:phosphoglycolate phosphatase